MDDNELIENCGINYCETVFTGHFFVEVLPMIGDVERLYIIISDNTLHYYDADLGWQSIGGSGGAVDWDDITYKPTEFPPSAHEHIDSEVELTETYTGNLAGAVTQKEANDIFDALVGGGGIFIRRSFFAPPFTSYRGFAPENSLETDAVWTITKTVENANGTIFSNEQVFNHKWTEINTI